MSTPIDCKNPVLKKGGHNVTSDYGPRGSGFHKGIDLVATGNKCDYIIAFADGKCTISKYSSSAGNYVEIDHGKGIKTRYLHMKNLPTIKVGANVKRGETLGYMGNTGDSQGAHLHFDININGSFVDPKPYLKGEKTFDASITVKEWQTAAVADGFKFPKYGCDGKWGAECEAVAKEAVCKKRLLYKYKNLTKIVQTVVGVTADGKFGTNTKAAVVTYQKSHGLTADGAVGVKTWKKILEV